MVVGGMVVVAHMIHDFSVSPRLLGFGFLGLKGLGPGLDKREIIYFHAYYKNVILCFIRKKRS